MRANRKEPESTPFWFQSLYSRQNGRSGRPRGGLLLAHSDVGPSMDSINSSRPGMYCCRLI